MAKTRHRTCESQIHQNSLLSLTDSFPVLVAPFADAAPRRPRHTTFENNKLCAKSHMSYYHSTYALYFLCCINLHLVIKDTKIRNYYRLYPQSLISKETSSWHLQIKKDWWLEAYKSPNLQFPISIIGVLSTSVRDLSCYKPERVTLFFIVQMDDCAKI